MPGAGALCAALRAGRARTFPTLLVGGHVSALPERTLREEACDFVCQGEGPHTIAALLEALRAAAARRAWTACRASGTATATRSAHARGARSSTTSTATCRAWPGTSCRWSATGPTTGTASASSTAASRTRPSTRASAARTSAASAASTRRSASRRTGYRSAGSVVDEIDTWCATHGVRNVKILDEMFVLNYGHVLGRVRRASSSAAYDLNIWAYARVDTVRPPVLDRLKRAGINWLALGIESGSAARARRRPQDVRPRRHRRARCGPSRTPGSTSSATSSSGCPTTTPTPCRPRSTWRASSTASSPTSTRRWRTRARGSTRRRRPRAGRCPPRWSGYSQHAVDTLPLPTRFVSAAEVLALPRPRLRRVLRPRRVPRHGGPQVRPGDRGPRARDDRAPPRAAARRAGAAGPGGGRGRDHQPHAVPRVVLRRGHGLPGVVPRARRRGAGHDDQQVLLHLGALPAAVLRPREPHRVVADRAGARPRRGPAPGRARGPGVPRHPRGRRAPPPGRPARAHRARLELGVQRRAAQRALRPARGDGGQGAARARGDPPRAGAAEGGTWAARTR